eukprot:6295587-Pyramimonas_sp.AAC.1
MHCCATSWAQVEGPFAAVRLSLDRAGWTVLSGECWRTNEGLVVQVFDTSPWAVRRLLERAVESWQRKHCLLYTSDAADDTPC